jgi:hypothetical protein
MGFMQVGLELVTLAICKSELQFQQKNSNQQRLSADGILIPNLH